MTSLPLLFALAVATVPPEYLIVPGKSVGPVRIGMTQAQVHAAWGKPTNSDGAPRQRGLLFKGVQPAIIFDEWSDGYEYSEGRIVYYVNGKVGQIEVQNSKYHLASGMSSSNLPPDWLRSSYGPFRFAVFLGRTMMSYKYLMLNRAKGVALRFNPVEADEEILFCNTPFETFVVVFAVGSSVIVKGAVVRVPEAVPDFKNMPRQCDHK